MIGRKRRHAMMMKAKDDGMKMTSKEKVKKKVMKNVGDELNIHTCEES